jgi:hypothetical protein
MQVDDEPINPAVSLLKKKQTLTKQSGIIIGSGVALASVNLALESGQHNLQNLAIKKKNTFKILGS